MPDTAGWPLVDGKNVSITRGDRGDSKVGRKMGAQAGIWKIPHQISDVEGTEMRAKNARRLVGCA